MGDFKSLNFCLGNLPLLSNAKTRSISAENPKGEVGGGAKEVPDAHSPAVNLGKGWKVHPCIKPCPRAQQLPLLKSVDPALFSISGLLSKRK